MNEETNNTNNSKHLFVIKCEPSKDEFRMLGRACELSAFSYIPPNRLYEPACRSVFNTKSSRDIVTIDAGYDNRTHRDDRRHAKQHNLHIWNEEINKTSPSRSSHDYGKRLVNIDGQNTTFKMNYLDKSDSKFAYISKINDFYNRNGINDFSPSKDL